MATVGGGTRTGRDSAPSGSMEDGTGSGAALVHNDFHFEDDGVVDQKFAFAGVQFSKRDEAGETPVALAAVEDMLC
eukprot:scaffold656385_cov51-Prasinocladus_malaysianus.AAC.1